MLLKTAPGALTIWSCEIDFGPDMLLRRHDYHVDIAGGFPAAQYVYEFTEAERLKFPTRRIACYRGDDMRPILDRKMVTIELSAFALRA